MAKTRRRVISILMALVLTLGLLPTAVLADEPVPQDQVVGYYHGSTVKENNPDNAISTEEDGKVKMVKAITQTGENAFRIDLTVETGTEIEKIPADAAVTLVIDISASMQWKTDGGGYCWNTKCEDYGKLFSEEDKHTCDEVPPDAPTGTADNVYAGNPKNEGESKWKNSRLESVVDALAGEDGFLDTFASGGGTNAKRMVRVVAFKAGAEEVSDWTDVSNADNLSQVKAAMKDWVSNPGSIRNDDKPTGSGTNIAAGLDMAKTGLDGARVSSNEFVVLLSDGAPNRMRDGKRDGDYWREINGIAGDIKEDVTSLYVVGYADAWDVESNLRSVASNGCYVFADSTSELNRAFEKIVEEIVRSANAWVVTDPMGDYITFKEFVGGYSYQRDNSYSESGNTVTWDLKKADYKTEGSKRVYTLSYTITLNTDASGFVSGETYPANKTTTLTYAVLENGSQVKTGTGHFRIPAVKGYVGSTGPDAELTLKKEWDDRIPEADRGPVTVKVGNKQVTLSSDNLWTGTITGLTPGETYTVSETGDYQFSIFGTGVTVDGNQITLAEATDFRLDVAEGKRTPSCSSTELQPLSGNTYLVGFQGSEGFVVWTYRPLSETEKPAFLKAVAESNVAKFQNITSSNDVTYIDGEEATWKNSKGTMTVNAEAGTVKFSGTNVWSQITAGTYTALYGTSENAVTITNRPAAAPGLEVTKTLTKVNGSDYASGSSVKVGDELTYTITVKNTGDADLTDTITVTDEMKAGLSYQSSTPSGTVNGSAITWTITDELASGATKTITVVAEVTSAVKDLDNDGALEVINTAKAKTDTIPEVESEVETPVTVPLTVKKTADKNSVYKNDEFTYTIDVTNNTSEDWTNVTVEDTLPSGVAVKVKDSEGSPDITPDGTVSSGVVTWSNQSIGAGKTATYTITVKVTEDPAQVKIITNTVDVIVTLPNDETLTGSDTCDVTVNPTVSLKVTKSFNLPDKGLVETAPEGFAATFTLYNAAHEKVAEFEYKDMSKGEKTISGLAPGTYYLQENVTNKGTAYSTQTDGQDDFTVTSVYIDTKGGYEVNVATAGGSVGITNTYKDNRKPNVDVTKTGPAAAVVTDVIEYTITAKNVGKVDAEDVVVTDKLDNDLTFVSASIDGAATTAYNAATGEWTIGELEAGKNITLTIRAQVKASAIPAGADEGTVVNTATVTYKDQDPDDGDTSTVTTTVSKKAYKYQIQYEYMLSIDGGEFTSQGISDTVKVSATEEPTLQDVFANPLNGISLEHEGKHGTFTYARHEEMQAGDVYLYPEVSFESGNQIYVIRVYFEAWETGSLKIVKTFDGLTDAQIAAVADDLTFRVTAPAGVTFPTALVNQFAGSTETQLAIPYSAFKNGEITLEGLTPAVYTIRETGTDVKGYTLTTTVNGSTAGTVEVIGRKAATVANVVNDYTGTEYRVIFLAGDHGVMNIAHSTAAAEGDYTHYIWVTTGTPEWRNEQPAGVKQYNMEARYDFDQSQLDAAVGAIDALNAPGVTADNNWSFDGFQLKQGDNITNAAYPTTGLAALMAMFDQYAERAEDGVLTLTFEATYSRDDDNGPPIVWPDPDPTPDTDLPDEDTPTTDLPDEGTPTTDLPDEDTPTTDLPDEETPLEDLPDEETPLADVPATGDSTGLWVLAAGVSGLALVWLALSGKKRREDNI